ncbi:uncharacterized protein [Lepeophtheirus salmonis]|uniref:DUF4806 domain-containing protein n=1 Tax=Lepeophtheirus salmonis TaxID=72036 RepID=A0A0K2SWX3_LEPSM|nr:uncharacterized protein LOC121129920 isoform X2 [Lepeophtheirus salmonis]
MASCWSKRRRILADVDSIIMSSQSDTEDPLEERPVSILPLKLSEAPSNFILPSIPETSAQCLDYPQETPEMETSQELAKLKKTRTTHLKSQYTSDFQSEVEASSFEERFSRKRLYENVAWESDEDISITNTNVSNHVILTEIRNLKHQLNDISSKVDRLCTILQQNHEVEPILPAGVDLPLQSKEDINSIEYWIIDYENFNFLVNHLSSLGGPNIKTIIKNIMSKVFTDNLMANLNWSGANGKLGIEKLNIVRSIYCAARKVYGKELTDYDIQIEIKKRLKGAADTNRIQNMR